MTFVILEKYAKKKYFLSFTSVPLEFLYNFVFPLVFSIMIGKTKPLAYLITIAMFVLLIKTFVQKVDFFYLFFKLKYINKGSISK